MFNDTKISVKYKRDNRIDWIDSAKAISIILVILGHVSGGVKKTINFDFVYGVHLVMFFVLSGFLFKKRPLTKEYLNDKFAHLMEPYFWTCLFILCTDIINSYCGKHDATLQTITRIASLDIRRGFFASGAITNFGTINVGARIGAIWFLPAMFFAVVFFQLLLRYTDDSRKLCVCSVVLALTAYISARFLWLPFSIQSGMLAVFFLWLGLEIRNYGVLEKVKWFHYPLATVLFVYGFRYKYATVNFVAAWMADFLISPVVGLAGCLLIYGAAKVTAKSRFLSYIGRNSMTVLCTHLYALETMGGYFNKILDFFSLTGECRGWWLIGLEIAFALVTAYGVDLTLRFAKQLAQKHENVLVHKTTNGRNTTIDIAKGIFIIAMIVGHFSIDKGLRDIIFSCHMPAFVFFSGYFYNKRRRFVQLMKNFLVPYALYVLCKLLFDYCTLGDRWSVATVYPTLFQYLCGISFTRNVFKGIPSVGPVSFILLLFVVRVLYSAIDAVLHRESQMSIAVILCSLFGVWLGKRGYWLPWSADVACYCLVFYHAGRLFSQGKYHQILDFYPTYFVASPIWVYMIYSGGLEIAVRHYGQYGIAILGSVMGIVVVLMLSDYLKESFWPVNRILSYIGEHSMVFLMVHAMLQWFINQRLTCFVSDKSILLMMFSLITQSVLVVIVVWVLKQFKALCSRNVSS